MLPIPNLQKYSSSLSTMDISCYYFLKWLLLYVTLKKQTEFFELTQIIFSFYIALSQIVWDLVHAL